MERIYLVTTGGSLENTRDVASGAVPTSANKIGQYLKRLSLPDCDVWVVPLTNNDGLEKASVDRANLVSNLAHLISHGHPIVITHGAAEMMETGIYVDQAFPELNAPVILTGTSAPLGTEDTDALQNLAESIFATRLLEPGVYVVIHGQVYPIDRRRLGEWFRYRSEK